LSSELQNNLSSNRKEKLLVPLLGKPKQPEEGREKGKALIVAFVRIANMTATWESQCRAALATRNKQEVYYYKDLIGSCNFVNSYRSIYSLTPQIKNFYKRKERTWLN